MVDGCRVERSKDGMFNKFLPKIDGHGFTVRRKEKEEKIALDVEKVAVLKRAVSERGVCFLSPCEAKVGKE